MLVDLIIVEYAKLIEITSPSLVLVSCKSYPFS